MLGLGMGDEGWGTSSKGEEWGSPPMPLCQPRSVSPPASPEGSACRTRTELPLQRAAAHHGLGGPRHGCWRRKQDTKGTLCMSIYEKFKNRQCESMMMEEIRGPPGQWRPEGDEDGL